MHSNNNLFITRDNAPDNKLTMTISVKFKYFELQWHFSNIHATEKTNHKTINKN